MEYIIGILILVSFFGLAFYAAKGGNLMMGMLVMAILWTVLPMIGNTFPTNPAFVTANAENVVSHGSRHSQKYFKAARKAGEPFWSTSFSAPGLDACS